LAVTPGTIDTAARFACDGVLTVDIAATRRWTDRFRQVRRLLEH
jgi:hypothetical protein